MGLFKSSEQKAEEKEAKIQKTLEFYGLTDITNQKDKETLRNIATTMNATALIEAGALLSSDAKTYANITSSYAYCIVQQNFIIIRMLNELLKKGE